MTSSKASDRRTLLSEADDSELARRVRAGDERAALELVERHRGLAVHLAGKYNHRGEQLDELVHVATIGLYKAVKRYDPEHGTAFSTFAVPTILGEIRQHFRSMSRTMRLPRRLSALARDIRVASDELQGRLGREPTSAEIAAQLNLDEETIFEALEAANMTFEPLDGTADEGVPDLELLAWEDREEVAALLDRLPERQRVALRMRYFDEMTQDQIAERLGISQMHVSRLLKQSLAVLRGQIDLGSTTAQK